MIYIEGVLQTQIDQQHIYAIRKRIKISVTAAEIQKLRLAWGPEHMPIYNNELKINVYGRVDLSHLSGKYAKYKLKISKPAPQYNKKRLIYKSAEILF